MKWGETLIFIYNRFGLVLFGSVRIPKLRYSVFRYFARFGPPLDARPFKICHIENPMLWKILKCFVGTFFLSTNSEIGGSVNLWPHGWLSKKNNNLDLFCIPAEECIQISKYYKFFFQKNILLAVHLDCFFG